MNILKEMEKQHACNEGIIWIKKQKYKSLKSLFFKALKEKKYDDINWALSTLLKKEDKIRYAIYSAKQVLYIFEAYSKDRRPKLAIKSAKNYLKNPTKENKVIAHAAYSAAYSAAYPGACASVCSAAYPAACSGACSAAYSAAYSAACAAAYPGACSTACAAAYSAACAAAYPAIKSVSDSAAKEKMQIKILTYGYKLLRKKL